MHTPNPSEISSSEFPLTFCWGGGGGYGFSGTAQFGKTQTRFFSALGPETDEQMTQDTSEGQALSQLCHLSTTATFFCPQGGHCGEVQLYY